jgi:hypothetical protein
VFGIEAVGRTSGWMMWPSFLATGRAPQPANASANANHGADALNRMQEYFVSVCFMEGTALISFISFSVAKRK